VKLKGICVSTSSSERVRYTKTGDLQGLYLKKYGYLLSVRTHKTIKQNSRLYVITKDASEPNQKIIPFLDPECNCKINDSAV
jgi:hypothetical protein